MSAAEAPWSGRAHEAALFGDLITFARDVIEGLGLVGVAALVALESVVPPIPSEIVLLLSGSLVAEGRFGPVALVLMATLGSVVGALVLYGLGAWVGQDRLRRVVVRAGRLLLVSERDLDRAEHWFERHGAGVVLVGRLVPVVRSLVSIPAGAERMALGRFVAYTAVGSAIWNTVFIGVGWALGERWEEAERFTEAYELAVVGVLVAIAAGLVLRGWLRRRRARAAAVDA